MKKNKVIIGMLLFLMIVIVTTMAYAVEKNNNPMLKNIKINGQEMQPEFEMFTTQYTIAVRKEVKEIKIEAIPDDEKATIEIIGDAKLKEGKNEIEIKVTAEDRQAKQSYFLAVTRGDTSKANANLSVLEVQNSDLSPIFSKEITNYAIEYPKEWNQVQIKATPEDSKATIEIIGNESLINPAQTIEIKVTAQDKQTVKTYTLIAKKAGISVQDERGTEPKEIEQEKNVSQNNLFSYGIIGLMIIVFILAIGMIVKRRKTKNEK